MKKSSPSFIRILGRIALVVAIIIIYAFGLQVTKVDLEKPQEAKRQEQLTNILRGLAHPDLVEYEIDRVIIDTPILVPCDGPAPPVAPAEPGPVISLSTNCAAPGEKIIVSGSGFEAGEDVYIYFVPFAQNADSEIELKLANSAVEVGDGGSFAKEVTLKRDRISEQVQTVRAVVNRQLGSPAPSTGLKETWNKIVETVFLAFIATTLGVIFAVPVSFLAARNLMLEVTSNFTRFMASLAVMPVGAWLGYSIFKGLADYGAQFVGAKPAGEAFLWALLPLVGLASVQVTAQTGNAALKAVRRWLVSGLVVAVAVIGFSMLGQLGRVAGLEWKQTLGDWSFFGNLVLIFSDVIVLGLPALGAFIGLFMLNPVINRILEPLLPKLSPAVGKVLAVGFAVLAGAVLFGVVAAALNWFYEFGNLSDVVAVPAVIGAVAFAGLAVAFDPHRPIPTGMFVYYVIRTIMNTFRSIEPLVMVVAFAVWVGIGPFAGVMALGLHTIVALGKLYSEQVENIAAGPIEAVTATGANRLQTIVYAVIPQIVPPYIAFTLYRWDINVRMSTIIGFGGGGGIGFLLSQNINLLKYRQASVNMIAIAIVVASLDYLSAKVREKIT